MHGAQAICTIPDHSEWCISAFGLHAPYAGLLDIQPVDLPIDIDGAEIDRAVGADHIDVRDLRVSPLCEEWWYLEVPGGPWRLPGASIGHERSSKSSEGAPAPENPLVSTQNDPQRCHKHPGALRES